MAGDEGVNLESFLNHALTKLPTLRQNRAVETFTTFNRAALQYMLAPVPSLRFAHPLKTANWSGICPDGIAVIWRDGTLPPPARRQAPHV
jgi:hypothetical protein